MSENNEVYLEGISYTIIHIIQGFIIAFFLTMLLSLISESNVMSVLNDALLNVTIIAVILKKSKRSLKSVVASKGEVSGKVVILSLMAVLGLFLIRYGIGELLVRNIDVFKSSEEELISLLDETDIVILIKVVITAPILEELLFRGIILDGIAKNHSAKKAIIVSSLMFALFHFNLVQSTSAFILSLFIAYLYMKTKSLKLFIFLHFFNNLVIFVLGFLIENYTKQVTENVTYLLMIPGALLFIGGFKLLNDYFEKRDKIIS